MPASYGLGAGAFEKRLPERQPVFGANAHRFRALHATDASHQVSGASRPLSAASTASLRTAVIRADGHGAEPKASRAPSHAFTVTVVKPGRLKSKPLGGVRRAPGCTCGT